MASLTSNAIRQYVNTNIAAFHSNRLVRLKALKLNNIMQGMKPYLFEMSDIFTVQGIVKPLLDAYLFSKEETIFRDFLKGLAIFVCEKVFSGRKSAAEGIDLEFSRDNAKYLVSIKSGPNWGNSSQIKRMRSNFKKAKKILGSKVTKSRIEFINGCCYGKDNRPNKGDYWKLCGQEFWELISGSHNLYIDIVEPLGHEARKRNDRFLKEYSRIINKFTIEFAESFCEDGLINWEKLVEFNSKKS